MNESEAREMIEVSLMEYANTLDYKKALEHGIERFIKRTNERATTNLSNDIIAREIQSHPQTTNRTIERFTNEHNFNNEETLEEL